jgi:Uncharacterized conserved protein
MPGYRSSAKVGVYVDVANIVRNGGYGMQYDTLREFACRDSAEPLRLNAYVCYDEERAKHDREYRTKTNNYYSVLREYGFKVIQKAVRWYEDESGNRYQKANADLDMAVDMLVQCENLDHILLATGDGDFVQVIRALQNNGCRVQIVAFDNVSVALRQEADMFISGYLIPNLLPIRTSEKLPRWGEMSSRVRGYCYHHDETKGFGFMRFMARIAPGLWITDTRNPNSPYRTVFFHDSNLPSRVNPAQLPSRDMIFEFTITNPEPVRDPIATNIQLIHPA